METAEQIKEVVKEKYAQIATQSNEKNGQESACCSRSSNYSIFSEDYSQLEGYDKDADLGLGCGIPTQFANIKTGDVVIDLWFGAGNDAFVVRSIIGEKGKVIGIDMTDAMIEKARLNNDRLGFNNVEFRLGEIEKIPCTSDVADVVVSNCVLNLVPDKAKAFSEIYRVIKKGGHFCVSDIVLIGVLPEKIKKHAEMYAGCVSSAIQKSEYLGFINSAGFSNIEIKKERTLMIPDDILEQYLNAEELEQFKNSKAEIQSITVYAEKLVEKTCCGSKSSCC